MNDFSKKYGTNPIVPCHNSKCDGYFVRQVFRNEEGGAPRKARNYCTRCDEHISYEDYYTLVGEAGEELYAVSPSCSYSAFPHQ